MFFFGAFCIDTASFVDELFVSFAPKEQSHVPAQQQEQPHGFPTSTSAPQQSFPFNAPSGPSSAPFGSAMDGYQQGQGVQDGANSSRKRSYNEGFQEEQENENVPYNRQFKTPRRGRGGGRGDWSGRDNRPVAPGAGPFPQQPAGGFPMMPPAFPGFDQNDPMAAMMAVQSMGIPQMPGMPPMPMPPGVPGQPQPQPDQMPAKSSERCPFYETQGICYLGATCPYQHDVPSKEDGECSACIDFFRKELTRI